MRLPKAIVVTVALAITTSAGAREVEAPLALVTDGLPEHLRARLEEKAREGKTALVRYLHRTRHMHNLRFEEIVLTPALYAKRKGLRRGSGE